MFVEAVVLGLIVGCLIGVVGIVASRLIEKYGG